MTDIQAIIRQLEQQESAIIRAIAALRDVSSGSTPKKAAGMQSSTTDAAPRKRTMSPAARKRIGEATGLRWAAKRAAARKAERAAKKVVAKKATAKKTVVKKAAVKKAARKAVVKKATTKKTVIAQTAPTTQAGNVQQAD